MVSAFVQFGVEGHHPTIRVLEFPVDAFEILLADAEFIENPQQFLVLLLRFLNRRRLRIGEQLFGDLIELRRRNETGAAWQDFRNRDRRAGWSRLDIERISQPPCADQAQAHAG